MRGTLAFAALRRNPMRTLLAVLGLAIAAALLIDMVMLATGMRASFRSMLTARGYELRVTPKGTLPFDTEASVGGASAIVAALRGNPEIHAVSPSLGTTVQLHHGGESRSAFLIGSERAVQGEYLLQRGRDAERVGVGNEVGTGTGPGVGTAAGGGAGAAAGGGVGAAAGGATEGSTRVLEIVANRALLDAMQLAIGDTLSVSTDRSAQLRQAGRRALAVIVGEGRFLYVPPGLPAAATELAALQGFLGEAGRDRMSLAMARVTRDSTMSAAAVTARIEAVRVWIEREFPRVTALSTETAIVKVEERLSYFRQLAFILGALSLLIGVLLVTTLVTLSVNERLGEIAVLRAIGVSQQGIVVQIMLEGLMLGGAGIVLGLGMGLVTATWLNGILRDFPGLPADLDFFLWSAEAAFRALGMLLVAATVAGAWPAWRASRVHIAQSLREEAIG